MENNEKSNITIGLPKENGAVFFAPLGTTLPTSASEDLDDAFVNLGYVSEDGVTTSKSESVDDIKAWGRETVMTASSEYTETVTLNFLETVRESVLKFVYGEGNVVVETNGEIKAVSTGDPLPRGVLVIDTLQNNGSTTPRIHRQVFGDCQFVDRSGDQVYNNSDPLTFPVVMKAYKFDSQAVANKRGYHDDFWTAVATVSA